MNQQRQVIIKIADNGPGIDPQTKKHLFERFYRSDNVRGTIAGSGLGLAIVQQLIQSCNGEIRLSDNHPHGAIFTVILPAISEHN